MDNLIAEFLIHNNARIDNGDKWLVSNEDDTAYIYTVYQHEYRKRQPITLYEGFNLEEALRILE